MQPVKINVSTFPVKGAGKEVKVGLATTYFKYLKHCTKKVLPD